MSSLSPTEQYYPSLLDGDTDVTHALFGGRGDVRDPWGNVTEPEFYMWAGARHIWLYLQKASLEDVRTTRSGSRACVEYILHFLLKNRKVALPLAVVGEEDGERLVRVRVYHSMFPIFGMHDNRWPILQADPELVLPDVIATYQHALAKGDVDGVLGTLEPDAVVREPSGGRYVHPNADAHRKFYTSSLENGGIPLEKCTILDDGQACALEYNVVRWGETDILPPRPGVAVYERSPNGKIKAVRIYDDLSPPD